MLKYYRISECEVDMCMECHCAVETGQTGRQSHLGGLLHDIREGVEVGVGAGDAMP